MEIKDSDKGREKEAERERERNRVNCVVMTYKIKINSVRNVR